MGGEREKVSIGNILTMLAMLGALGGVWAALAADNTRTKERLEVVERRQIEDRVDVKEDRREMKHDIKETKESVQQILIKLQRMEAQQANQWRREDPPRAYR